MIVNGYSPYTIFLSIYLEDNSYGRGIIGWLWVLGMLAGISASFVISRLMAVFSFRTLLLMAHILTTLRWLLIGFLIDNLAVLMSAQNLQAATIGILRLLSWYRLRFWYLGQRLFVGLVSLAALATVIAFIITWYCMENIRTEVGGKLTAIVN